MSLDKPSYLMLLNNDTVVDENILKNNMFLYVGRANDPIKRFNLVRNTLFKIKRPIPGQANTSSTITEPPKIQANCKPKTVVTAIKEFLSI